MAELDFDFSEGAPAVFNQDNINARTFAQFANCNFGVYSAYWGDDGEVMKEVGRNPNTGDKYSPNNPATSLSLDEALEEIERLRVEAPGRVYGPILYMPDGLVCVDFDDTDAPDTKPEIQRAHYDLMDYAPTWVEKSVSSVGYHAFYELTDVEAAQLANTNNGEKKVDTRVLNGFVFLTGDVVSDMEVSPFDTLHEGFRDYLYKRSALTKEASQGSNAQWRDIAPHNDFEVMVQMFRRCPETANYMFKSQSQTGSSEMHYRVLMDLIQCSLNYEQVKRLYLKSPCAEYMNRSEGRATQSHATYERWLTKNIHKAASDLEASGRMFNPEDVQIAFGEEGSESEFEIEWSDSVVTYTPTEWIIQGILPARGVASIYGPSGSGKTFLALDMLMAVSRGMDWMGKRTRQVPVTYVGLEGEAGLKNRIYAYRIHHGDVGEPMMIITKPLNILKSEDQEKLIRTVYQNRRRGGIICIDTMAKSAAGMNENDSAEMSAYVAAVEALAKECQCLVILIHHSGKDTERGPRGHSSFIAGIDAALATGRDRETGTRSVNLAKSKDGGDDFRAFFALKGVEVGTDQWGQPDTSCVVQEVEEPTERVPDMGGIMQGSGGIPDEDIHQLAGFINSCFPQGERFPMKPRSQNNIASRMKGYSGWPGWDAHRINAIVKAGASRGYFEIETVDDGVGPEDFFYCNA